MSDREKFERWITASGRKKNLRRYAMLDTKDEGRYQDPEIQLAWEAWQEARKG